MNRYRPIGCFLALLVSSTAFAQAPAQRVGAGVKLGEGTVLHPSLGVQTGYLNNVFYEEDTPVSSGILRVIGGLRLATLPPQRMGLDEESDVAVPKLEFSFGAGFAYREFLTSNDFASDQRDVGLNGDLRFVAFPKGPFRFEVNDSFRRVVRARNFETSGDLDRVINDLSAGFVLAPGGGALQFSAYYGNVVDIFEDSHAQFANRLQQTVRARVDWTFFPFSKAWFEGSLGFFGGLGADSTKVGSMPLRLQLGLSSALTPTITLRARAGFAKGFYNSGPDFTTPIGALGIGWQYAPTGNVSLDYHYDVRDSINANYYSEHHIGLQVRQGLGSRLIAMVTASSQLRKYEGVPAVFMAVGGATTRFDVIGSLGGTLELHTTDWLTIVGRYTGAVVDSDIEYMFDGVRDDPGFVRHEATLGVEANY